MTTAVRVLRHAIALGFAAGLVLGLPASAQNGPPRLNFNSGAPIEILADSLEVQDSSSSAVFVGNVKVTQDRMILRADRLEVIYAGGSVADAAGGGPSGIKRITAKGNVFVTSGEDSAQGDAAVYDPAKGTVTMTGKVLLTPGRECAPRQRTGGQPEHRPQRHDRRRQRCRWPGEGLDRPRKEDRPMTEATPPVAETGLVAHSLGKIYNKRPVVRGVSLNLQRGEVVGLLGPNGAGKTTCFYMISGLIAPDYGNILFDGRDVTALPMYRRARLGIGYLPQEASIFRGLTVEDNIRSVLEIVETERDRREAILDDLLAEFSIVHLRKTSSVALSGGERRRVEIARGPGHQPQLHPAGRTAGRHRSDRGRRHPPPDLASERSGHRRADHRSQCPRNAGHDRQGLHYSRGTGSDGGTARRGGRP